MSARDFLHCAVYKNQNGYINLYDIAEDRLELKEILLEIAEDLCYGCHMSEYEDYHDETWLQKYVYRKKHLNDTSV
ncbi:hypothetical protein AALB81_08835 [Lachnospiraceae bacterium 48-33]